MRLEAGTYDNLPIGQYISDAAISKSDLFAFSKSPTSWMLDRRKPSVQTPATLMGNAVDCALTEPDAFPLRYSPLDAEAILAKAGKKNKNATEWREAVAAVESTGKQVLDMKQYQHCIMMRDRVHGHPEARKRVEGAVKQATLVWERGVPNGHSDQTYLCKSRPDLLHPEYGNVNIKTTRSTNIRRFHFACLDYGYYWDVAWSLEAMAANQPLFFPNVGEERYEWLLIDKETLEPRILSAPKEMIAYSKRLIEEVWPRMVEAIDHAVIEPRYPEAEPLYPPEEKNEDEPEWADEIKN